MLTRPRLFKERITVIQRIGRFFELFTLPANLRLNTQRKSAPSMRAFKEEERSVLISVTLLNERNYRVQNCTNYWHHVHYVSEGSNHVTAT